MSEEKQKTVTENPEPEKSEKTEKVLEEDVQEKSEETVEEKAQPKEDKEKDKEKEEDNARYMRLMAEFQNYKKRVAKEKSDIHAYANEKLVTELLTVLDNFERALESDIPEGGEGYAKGMKLIFEQLRDGLVKAGLKEIEALGEKFDPAFHNAVMTEDSDEYESEHVTKVLQKGYSLNGKVIRPAMVMVAN